MKAVIICGMTGSGKTTQVKNLLKNFVGKNISIYDVNNEYNKGKNLLPFEQFCVNATRLKNSVIVFEEATIFLNNRGTSNQLIDILVRKRHTNNFIILVFHSLRAIPRYVFDLSNYLILLRTNDSKQLVEQKYKGDTDLINGFDTVNKAQKYASITITLN